MKKNGFTLIELLMTVVIIGIIGVIAVVSISSFLETSRKKTYVRIAQVYIDAVREKVNSGEYPYTNISSVYYIPLSCINIDRKESSPYGKFDKGYVVLTFTGTDNEYYFYARDDKGYGIDNVQEKDLKPAIVKSNMDDVTFKLIDDKELIESMDEDTCSTSLVMKDMPETSQECFEVQGDVITNYLSEKEACGKVISIPEEINGHKISKIGDYAFADKNLTVAIIPDAIKEIGESAFFSNNLSTIILSDNVVSIGDFAFQLNKISHLEIGKSLKLISEYAFADNLLVNVTLPDQITTIDKGAFARNKLKQITLPNQLTEIGNGAFYNNRLTDVEIPKTVKEIGGASFNDNLFPTEKAFIYNRKNGVIDYSTIVSYAGKERNNVIIPAKVGDVELKTLGNLSFQMNAIKNITIPNSVEELGKQALTNNQLTTITLPSNLKKIGDFAFWGNFNLTELQLPNGVKDIGNHFIYETNIKTILIPNSVENLAEYAFENIDIEEIEIDKKREELDNYPWGLKDNLNRITFLQ